MISVWIGYSMCRGPAPSTTEPSGPTRMTFAASISSSPHPALFIQAPRPPGSRMLACPHTMSPCPAAASALEARAVSRTAPLASAGW